MFKINLSLTPDDRLRAVVFREKALSDRPPLVNKTKLETGPKSSESRPGWGSLTPRDTGLTRYGRMRLQQALGWLDKNVDSSELLFITLTVPGDTFSIFEAIAANSSRLIHDFKAWINKRLPSKLDAYVWEYQKRGALHLHYVVHCPDQSIAEGLKENVKDQWIRQLDRLSEATGIDLYERRDGNSWRYQKDVVRTAVETVKKSVSRYMSKYMSKSARNSPQGRPFPHPARYYGVSRPLLAAVESATARLSLYCAPHLAKAQAILEDVRHWLESLCPNRFIESSPFPQVIALCGSIEPFNYSTISDKISRVQSIKELKLMTNDNFNESANSKEQAIQQFNIESFAVAKQIVDVVNKVPWLRKAFALNCAQTSIETLQRTQRGYGSTSADYAGMFNCFVFCVIGFGVAYDGPDTRIQAAVEAAQAQLVAYRNLFSC